MVASPEIPDGSHIEKPPAAPRVLNPSSRLRLRVVAAFVLVNVLAPLFVHIAGEVIGGRVI